jgi:hypothetical protein
MSQRIRNSVAGAATLILAAVPALAQPTAQPEVVCDLTPALAGSLESGSLRSSDAGAGPLRLSFRRMDAAAGRALMTIGQGESGELEVAMAVEPGALSFLAERPGVSKTIVTVQTKPLAMGWAGILSQHSWVGGNVSVRVLSGSCLLRNPR